MFAVCELLRDPTLAQRLADRPGDMVVTRALEEELHGLLDVFQGEYTGLVFSAEGFEIQVERFCRESVGPIVAAGGTVGGSERMWRAREHAREACAAFEQALRRPESSQAEAVARALTTMRSETSGVGVPEDTIRATLRASCPDTLAAVAALVGHGEFETELDRLAGQACARLRDPLVTAQLVDDLPNIYDPAYDAIVRAVRDAGLGFGEFAAAVRDRCPEIISLRPSGLVPPGYSHRELPPPEFFQGICDGMEVLAGLPADERAERLGALVLLLLAAVDESELETELMLAVVLQACGGPLPPDLAI